MLANARAALRRVGVPPPPPPPPRLAPRSAWTRRTRGRAAAPICFATGPAAAAASHGASLRDRRVAAAPAVALSGDGPAAPGALAAPSGPPADARVDAPLGLRPGTCGSSGSAGSPVSPMAAAAVAAPPPADDDATPACRLFAPRQSLAWETCPPDAARERRLVRARAHLLVALAASDSLAAGLQRSGRAEHRAFVTRRELRQRAEVPLANAGRAFDAAMAEELGAWLELSVFEEVAFSGQRVLSTRWVLTLKQPEFPTAPPRRKARLVVRGFEDPDRDAVDSLSQTASRATLRTVFSALASAGFLPRSLDVRTAFLQGMPLDRPTAVFVQPPPQARAPAGVIWRLRKCAYGLTDAPRRWYESVLALMRSLSLVRSSVDHGLFARHADGALELAVAVHMDDFFFGGTTAAVAAFEAVLRALFAAGPTTVGAFTFTGLSVRSEQDDASGALTLSVNQDAYVDSIDSLFLPDAHRAAPTTPLTATELTLYRSATGALLWATGQTQPFLACAAALLARRFTCAVVADLRAANRVIAAARAARPLPLTFPTVGPGGRLRLLVDASSVKTGVPVAHTGYAVFASPASVPAGRLAPDAPLTLLAYGSHRQRRVTHSSFAAEVYAMLEGVRAATEVAVVHALLSTGDEYRLAPLDVYTDNLSLYNTLDAAGVVTPKEVGAAVQELRDLYHAGALATVTWLRAHGQLADILTKPNRRSALADTVRSGCFGVRLGPSDFLSKPSSARASTLVGSV